MRKHSEMPRLGDKEAGEKTALFEEIGEKTALFSMEGRIAYVLPFTVSDFWTFLRFCPKIAQFNRLVVEHDRPFILPVEMLEREKYNSS